MPPAIEIARFKVKEGVEDELLGERSAMLAAMRRHFPSHGDAYLCKLDDGSWIDVVIWNDREQAERAAYGAFGYPDIAGWFRHLDESTGFDFEYGAVRHISPGRQTRH